MVRARSRSHLEALRRRFADRLSGCTIHQTGNTDYPCRLFVDKEVWVSIAADLACDIDYDNFKGAVAAQSGEGDAPYRCALHEVWEVMREFGQKL